MDFFKKVFKYMCKLCLALILTPTLVILLNYLTNDSLIKMISITQNSDIYKNYFIYTNPCESLKPLNNMDNSISIKENYFIPSLGSCYVDKLKEIDLIEIETNYGGRTTSALVLAREIKRNNINVKIKEECYSACVDVLMHGNKRLVCENAIVGIHQQSAKINNKWLNMYLIKNNEFSMKKYEDFGLNSTLILDIINKTPSDEMYELSKTELLKTGIATQIIACN